MTKKRPEGRTGIVPSDICQKLKEEIAELREILVQLTAERDELKYQICPELAARYAREIGNSENRISYQRIVILELKRRIEIARAALNRERTVSKKAVDQQIEKEYSAFHERVRDAYEKSREAERAQKEREERQRRYEEEWKQRYGTGDAASSSGTGGPHTEERTDSSRDHAGEEEDERAERPGEGRKRTDIPDAKALYRRIVKRLHPDINPNITERQKELFYRATDAYREGNIAVLQEICDELFGDGAEDPAAGGEEKKQDLSLEELQALRDRLKEAVRRLEKEIAAIRSTFPYTMKALLDDPEALEERKRKLEEEIRQNEETIRRLNGILEDVNRQMEELKKKGAGNHAG